MLEANVFATAESMVQEYDGGFWEFVTTENGGKFLIPNLDGVVNVHSELARVTVPMTSLGAGLVLTMLVCNHMVWHIHEQDHNEAQKLQLNYDRLYEFVFAEDSPITEQDQSSIARVLD